MKLNVESSDWFVKPEMMGHIWAKETVSLVKEMIEKYVKTPVQKALCKCCLNLDSVDWHYWSQLTKKYIATFRYVVKRIEKDCPVALLHYVNTISGCLKNELTWYLENKCFVEQPEEYYRDYRIYFTSLGMSEEDCVKRFNSYHDGLLDRITAKGWMA